MVYIPRLPSPVAAYNLSVAKFTNGCRYEGEWEGGKFHGDGVMRYPSGAVYTGEFREGKRCGQGVLRYKGGNVYDGEFEDNHKHGRGTMTTTRGHVYKGDWVKNEICGSGTLNLPSSEHSQSGHKEAGETITKADWPPRSLAETIVGLKEDKEMKAVAQKEDLWDLLTDLRQFQLDRYVRQVREFNVESERERVMEEENARRRQAQDKRNNAKKARAAAIESALAAADGEV